MRYYLICLFALFFVKQGVYAQNTARYLLWAAKEAKLQAPQEKNQVKILLPGTNSSVQQPLNTPNNKNFQLLLQPKAVSPIVLQFRPAVSVAAFPSNYYASCLGWVCKQELKMDKKTALPLRFRLGGKDQVDWLEGKQRH